jgi:CBS domain-containing protein
MRLMTDQRVRHVPVVDEGNELVGVVSIGDVVKNRMDELEAERSALMDYITQGG